MIFATIRKRMWHLLAGIAALVSLSFALQLAAVGAGASGVTSDNGLRIVFSSNGEASTQSPRSMYVMKPDGSGLRPVEFLEGDSGDHACSPRDNRIAFTSTSVRSRPGIYVVSIDGSSQN